MKQLLVRLLALGFSLVALGCTINMPPPGEGVKDILTIQNDPKIQNSGALTGQVVPAEPAPVSARDALILSHIKLPEGFSIQVYADVPNARSMSFAYDAAHNSNYIFVGNKDEGNVYVLIDSGADNTVDEVRKIASNWNSPNGVAFKDGNLYVAEIDKIHVFEHIIDALYSADAIDSTIFYDQLPDDAHHGWKYIAFGPEGDLYVPVGAPCNICDRELPYSSVMRLDLQTKASTLVARGIRNTVGFARDPTTRDLRFTDNGRDTLGDTIPPDELNHVTSEGEHFGYPYCYGQGTPDPDEGDKDCSEYTPPVVELGAHVASLGMKFYYADMFPSIYQGKIFIAEHGSWNSSVPVGYQVVAVDPVTKQVELFAQGRLSEGKTWGRPVDILILPDGSVLISDDYAGIVYRVSYSG